MKHKKTNREHILDCAERALAAHGTEGASLRQIAEDAGITAPAIKYHFPLPGELFETVYEGSFRPMYEKRLSMLDAVEEASGDSPCEVSEILRAFVLPTFEIAESELGETWTKLAARARVEQSKQFKKAEAYLYEKVLPRFLKALCASLPETPRDEVRKSLLVLQGLELDTLINRFNREDSSDQHEPEPLHQTMERMLVFAEAGIRAVPSKGGNLNDAQVEIRRLVSDQDFEDSCEIQRRGWGFDDKELMPAHFMRAINSSSCQIGAFIEGVMIGILLAYPSRCENLYIGQMSAVLPLYRDHGIGMQLLKMANILVPSMRAVQFTYDPLEPRNAHLYHSEEKLGAIGIKAAAHYYQLASEHHKGMPTHRLICLKVFGEAPVPRSGEAVVTVPGSYSALRNDPQGPDKATALIEELGSEIDKGSVVVNFIQSVDPSSPSQFVLGHPTAREKKFIHLINSLENELREQTTHSNTTHTNHHHE